MRAVWSTDHGRGVWLERYRKLPFQDTFSEKERIHFEGAPCSHRSAQKHGPLAAQLYHSISCLPASCRLVTHLRVRRESSSRDDLSRQRGRCSRSSLRPGQLALHEEHRQGGSWWLSWAGSA